jgi:hypothetical protein
MYWVFMRLLHKTEVDAGAPQVTTDNSKLLQEAAGNLPAVFYYHFRSPVVACGLLTSTSSCMYSVFTCLLHKTEVDPGAPQVTTGHSKLLQEAAGKLLAVF